MGRKRKSAACLAPAANSKLRRQEQATGGWASLPTDVVELVTGRLLDDDVADYIVFRAICSAWRACTPTPCGRDPRYRPRGWIALCDGDAIRPEEAGEIALFHTRTARCLRVRLPKLRGYRIVCLSDGLLVLLHKRNAVVSVLNPLTRAAVEFPSLASVYHEAVRSASSLRAMNAAVCMTSYSMAVVVWFPYSRTPVVVAAEAGSDHWLILHRNLYVENTLLFEERLYAVAPSFEILQLYPPRRPPQVARVPSISPAMPTSATCTSRSSVVGSHPVLMHSLTTGLSEEIAEQCKIHDEKGRIRPSVRPFTIADHLITFCNPHEWAKGLMFHEYYFIPKSFKELRKKIREKEWQLRSPPAPINIEAQSERQLTESAKKTVKSVGTSAD